MDSRGTFTVIFRLACLCLLGGVTAAQASDGTWTNGGGVWSNTSGWASGTVADGATFTATFSGPPTGLAADATVTNDTPRTIGNLWFTNSNGRTWYVSGSNLTFDADGTGGGTSVVYVAATNLAQFSQKSFGTTNSVLNKTGPGQWILSRDNTGCYSGRVVLTQGSLSLNHSNATSSTRGLTLGGGDDNVTLAFPNNANQNGSGYTVSSSGTGTVTLSFNVANSLEFNPSLTLNKTAIFNIGSSGSFRMHSLPSGAGGLYKTGAGELMYYYNGTATYSGTTTVSQGSIMIWANVGGGLPSGKTVIMGDTGTGANGISIVLGGAPVTPNVNLLVTTNGTSATLTAGRNGSSAGDDTWSGTIQIDRPYLRLSCNDYASSFTVNSAISGVGGVRIDGSTARVLALTSSSNAYTGGTYVANGILKVTGSGKLGTGPLGVSTNGTVRLWGGSAAIADTADVSLEATDGVYGRLSLTNGVNDTIHSLYLGGVVQIKGTYGSSASSATYKDDNYFDPAFSGMLTVTYCPGGTLVTLR